MPATGSSDWIFVQVARGGFLYRCGNEETGHSSNWMDAGSVFTVDAFRRRYGDVRISLFTPKVTIAPPQFIPEGGERELLASVADLGEDDTVERVDLPEMGVSMVYSLTTGETFSRTLASMVLRTDGGRAAVLPELYYMLKSLSDIPQYNKIVAGYADGRLYLVIAEGRSLKLCNVFDAADFTTAEYFLFLAVKSLNFNPELSDVHFRTPLSEEEEISLCSYFRSVER